MNIPKTTHKKIKYRNGKTDLLLTTERKQTKFSVMSLRDENDSVIYHYADGSYIGVDIEHDLDIVEVEN